jgi:hypothetical protein
VKEKLKALLEKLKSKLKLSEGSKAAGRVGKIFSILKWSFFILFGSVISVSLAVMIWFYLQPLDKLAPKLESFIQQEIKAERVSLGKIKWKFALSYLGLGLVVDKVKIDNAPEFKQLEMGSLQFVTQPFKLFLGKFPFSFELKDSKLVLNPPISRKDNQVEAVLSNELATELLNETTKDRIRKYLDSTIAKLIRVQIDILNFKVESHDTVSSLNVDKGKVVISGFPGTFTFDMDVDTFWNQNRWKLEGNSQVEFSGFFQMWEKNLVGIKIEKIDLDLKNIQIEHQWGLQKPKGMDLWIYANSQLIIDKNLDLTSVDLTGGKFIVDEIQTEFTALFKTEKDFSFHWFSAPREMESLELPIVGVSDIPAKGIFELNANAKMTEKYGLDATWKMNFNNFVVEASKLKRFVDPESFGQIRFSFVNEIELKGNTIRMPRAEFQFNGTGSQIEMADHKFIKPKGDKLELLIKAGTKEDNLHLDHINIQANNLAFEAKAEMFGFSEFVMNAVPGRIKADVLTNTVDLTPWSPYFPIFRKVPLEGTVQFSGSADGPVYSDADPFREVSWRIDRLSANKIRGSIDRDAFQHFGIKKSKTHFNGPFSIDFLLQGRGFGDRIHRGSFLAHVDLSKMGMVYREQLRKPAGVPLLLDFSLEKSQNRLIVRRGQLKAHEADLVLSGQLAQGSHRSELDFKIQKPIQLQNWRDFFSNLPKDMPLSGEVKWNGKISFDGQEAMEGNVDLGQLSLEGMGEAKNLNFWLPEFSKTVEGGFGKILFQKDGIYIPEAGFKSGETTIKGSGSAIFKTTKSNLGTIARYLGSDPMDVTSQISIDQWDESFFSKNVVGSSEKVESTNNLSDSTGGDTQTLTDEPLFDFKSILNSPRKRLSTVKMAINASVSKKSRLKATQLGTLVLWNQGVMKAEPLHFLMWGGEFKGSIVVDTRMYSERKESPLWTINGSLKDFDFEPLLRVLKSSHSGSLGGSFTGNIQWVGEGLDTDNLSETLRGRITGQVNDGFIGYLDTLRGDIRTLVQNSAATDYFLDTVDVDKCFPAKINSGIDAQLRNGILVIEKGSLQFEGGTTIDVIGSLDKKNMDLSGTYSAGEYCYTPKIAPCYKRDFEKISFSLKGKSEKLESGVNAVDLGKKLADCLDLEIGRQTIINKKAEEQEKVKGESLADKWKNMIRGSK